MGTKTSKIVGKNENSNMGIVNFVDKNPEAGKMTRRIMVGIPCTGLLRVEWVQARFSQVLPTNWSYAEVWQFMSSYMPMAYQLSDAENLIAKTIVEQNYEWLLFIESDNVIPPNTFRKLNEYMMEKKYAVVGGLYFTKSNPAEPMIYRGRGNGYFDKWKMGDKVMCDGLPFGCTLISGDLIREIWKDSPEYTVNGVVTRRVFESPQDSWRDPISGAFMQAGGTSDLNFFTRVIKGKYLEKAGFPHLQKMKYPFLVDTSIFVRHIDNNGVQWPLDVPKKFDPGEARMKEMIDEFSGPFK
jgi:hypothetical protein